MKITETITRDCCNTAKDLRAYDVANKIFFCIHCGTRWKQIDVPDPSGHGYGIDYKKVKDKEGVKENVKD